MSGFVYTSPGGRHYTQSIGIVAGNASYTLTPATEVKLWLLGTWLQLVADATVASRVIRVARYTTVGNYRVGLAFASGAVAASETKNMASGPGYLAVTGSFTQSNTAHLGVAPLLLDADHYLKIDVSAGVAGDSLTGFLELMEVPL